MHNQHAPARAFSLLCVALLLGTGFTALADVAQAGTQHAGEDWELGSSGWTSTTFAATDCTAQYAYRGLCSLEINARVNGQLASASKNLSLTLQPPGYVLSYYFRADWPYLRSAGEFKAQLGTTSIKVNHSYGPGNRVALYANDEGTGALIKPSGQPWSYTEKTWYRILLKADLVGNTLRIEVRGTDGALLATGPALSLISGSSIGLVSFEGRYSGNSPITEAPQKMNYDWLTVTEPDPPTAPQLLTTVPGPGLGQIMLNWFAPADDGGVPVLRYNVYRGDSASTVTTLLGSTTSRTFTDSGMMNGETHFYAVRAVNAKGESPPSNTFQGVTFNVPTAPVNLVALPGPNVGSIRLTWQAPTSNGGAAITNYRIYRGAEAGNATLLAELGNVLAYMDTHRPNGTRWYYNVTAVNFVGEGRSSNEASSVPRADATTVPAGLVLRPDPWWTDQPRELRFTYSVAASQCAPSEACPIEHEWRVYQDGSTNLPDGILLASGRNTHSGHAETTAYTVDTTVTPTGLDGMHRLKVAVSPRVGDGAWRIAGLSFTNGLPQPDPTCNGEPGFFSYIMPGIAPAPNATGRQYAKTYGYKLNGTVSQHRALFMDGCLANGTLGQGDGHYELGYGGLLLDQSDFGTLLQLLDSTGNHPRFVLGTDLDGSGILGDSALDCFRGPFTYFANVTCAPDSNGKIILILLPETGSQPGELPTQEDPIWGRGYSCMPLSSGCKQIYHCPECGGEPGDPLKPGSPQGLVFFVDKGKDGIGDAYQENVETTAAQVDKILGPHFDQEFPAGFVCDPAGSPGSCVGGGVGDGLTTLQEFRWNTWPLGALKVCSNWGCATVFPNARDYDGDNWEDGEEQPYWNNEANDLVLNNPTWAAIQAAPRDDDAAVDLDGDTLGTLHDPDSDNDGLPDGDEFKIWKTYPEFADSDCAMEEPTCSTPSTFYSRHAGKPGTGDKINDTNESQAWGADWNNNRDGDGIQSNLLDPDSDADGLLDGLEFHLSVGGKCALDCTNPLEFDTDHDGLLDGSDIRLAYGDYRVRMFIAGNIGYTYDEVAGYRFYGEATAGTNRTNPDTDGDGLPDGWEAKYGGDALVSDAGADPDQDLYHNLREYSYGCGYPCPASPIHWGGTNPRNPDTDADGLLDGNEDADKDGRLDTEESKAESNPLEPDTDLDGLTDGAEVLNPSFYYSSRPWDPDTDDDGLTDYQEIVTYAPTRISPRNPNSDGWAIEPRHDSLTDYQEIVLYGTNPNGDMGADGYPLGWDTDKDGIADGTDANPKHNDSPPVQRTIPPVNPLQTQHSSYVTFSQDGYIDVYVKDVHGSEAEIELVYVQVLLKGTVDGQAGQVRINEEARRLDEAGTWGLRIPMPEHMSEAYEESFTLTVVSSIGGSTDLRSDAYHGKFTEGMSGVEWQPEADPKDDWHSLDVHDNLPVESRVAGGWNGAPMLPTITDVHNLSLEDIFEAFGNFTVYRLKPGAILASDVANVTAELGANASRLAIAYPLNDLLGEDNASYSVNITYFEDAFELVDPLAEPGVYASQAGGGSSSFRTPKFMHTGVRKGWEWLVDTTSSQAASFWHGAGDPRANGAIVGDIVSGILIYGDVRDCGLSEDTLTVGLGCLGLALTVTTPIVDGPFAVFKATVKSITNIPNVGKKVALQFLTDAKALSKSSDSTALLKGIRDLTAEANWVRKNPGKALAYDHYQRSIPFETRLALHDHFERVVDYVNDLKTAYPNPNQAAKIDAMLAALSAPNRMFADPAQGLKEMGEVAVFVRTHQPEGAADFAKGIAHAASKPNGPNQLPGIENADAWKNDVFSGIRTNEHGRKGFILEAKIVGRCSDGFYKVPVGGTDRIIKVTHLDVTYDEVEILDDARKIVGSRTVQVDVQDAIDDVEMPFFMDGKSAASIGTNEYNQMEGYAGLARKEGGEVVWFLEGKPTADFYAHVAKMVDRYGVRIHLLDADTGAPLITYV